MSIPFIIIVTILFTILSSAGFAIYLNNKFKEELYALKTKHEQQIKNISKKQEDDLEKLSQTIEQLRDKISAESLAHDNSIDNLRELIESNYNELLTNMAEQSLRLIRLLREEIDQLKKKIAVFTEIDSDSKNLNTNEDLEKQDALIKQALTEIQQQKHFTQDQYIQKTNPEEIIETALSPKSETKKSEPPRLQILDDEQLKAYKELNDTNNNFFITGKAGTGKSFLLRMFERGTKKRILKVAPTGIAALNIDGATIHSAFGFENLESITLENLNEKTIKLNHDATMVLKHIDTLIIDEISMVRADIFDKIDKILKIINKTDDLFGGKQVIIFGDLFQLPPIASRDEEKYLKYKYGGMFFFNSYAYNVGNFKFIELQTNHRQESDAEFFDVLNRIREGISTQEDIQKINSHVKADEDQLRRVVRLFPKRADADLLNRTELEKIPAKQYCYTANITYNKYNKQNVILENYFPIVTSLKLKVGALVMMTKNDIGKRWVNGTLAIVSKLSNNNITVTINGFQYDVTRESFETKEATYQDGKIHYSTILEAYQFPMMLAYAITIHKSQGTTYQKIACDISNCFSSGQAYVALSRCTTFDGLHLLSELNIDDIKVDPKVKSFYLNAKNAID